MLSPARPSRILYAFSLFLYMFIVVACSYQPTISIPIKAPKLSLTIPASPYDVQIKTLQEDPEKASLFNAGDRLYSWKNQDRFLGAVQPLLGKRCVVCHGCTDSPCQLKLNSMLGIRRGVSRINYYAANITENQFPVMEINAPGFHPVINNESSEKKFLIDHSLLYQFVELGQKNTTDNDKEGPFDLFKLRELQQDFDRNSNHQCVTNITEFDEFAFENPYAGMPFGLPRINDKNFSLLKNWIGEGSLGPSVANEALLNTPSKPDVIATWERFLNQQNNKSKLLSRYIFEHLASADIHFDEMPGQFFRIVRSRTQYHAIEEIITPLVNNDPAQKDFYYRLKKIVEIITAKDHVIWKANYQTLNFIKELFIDNSWTVADSDIQLPDYASSNPFSVFRQIPAELRYRFLLTYSKTFIESMLRSSVCIGRTATYAISDHFWVFFLKPEIDVTSGSYFYRLGSQAMEALESDTDPFLFPLKMKQRFDNNKIYIDGYEQALRKELTTQVSVGIRPIPGLGLNDIWKGNGTNPNAWLTVLRHDASATVHYGQEGGFPQSIMVLNYANLERLFYNLVVNYKYWGSASNKLISWQSMSHERLEGEDLFISFLPEKSRKEIRNHYSGNLKLVVPELSEYLGNPLAGKNFEIRINLYPLLSKDRKAMDNLPGKERADIEFARRIKSSMSELIQGSDDKLNSRSSDGDNIYEVAPAKQIEIGPIENIKDWEKYVQLITEDRGKGRYVPFLPSITLIRVGNLQQRFVYSLISNRGYATSYLVFDQELTRDESRDTLSIIRGVVGDYPELFLDVDFTDAASFLQRVQSINGDNYKTTLRQLKKDYAVTRNSSKFWPFVDWLHDWMVSQKQGYINAGVLDLSRYDLYDRN